jgi:pimeloyl-ACP methyl ester carboxylesterase
MAERIRAQRRSMLGMAALGVAAARAGGIATAEAGTGGARAAQTSFAALKRIAAGPLVPLLQGWPYGIHSHVEVAPVLAAAGYRVIVPDLRGHGATRSIARIGL